MSIKGRVQVNGLVHLVTIFRLPLKEASSLDERPINLLTAGVLVVVGLLGDGVHKLGAVRDDTAVIGETFPARVVGDGVMGILCGLLGPDQLAGQQEHGDTPGQHGLQSTLFAGLDFKFYYYYYYYIHHVLKQTDSKFLFLTDIYLL